MNNSSRPYCVLRHCSLREGEHTMKTATAEQTISDIAKETLDFSILEGKTTGLSEEAINTIAQALFEAYNAGYQARQQDTK